MKRKGSCCCGFLCRCVANNQKRGKGSIPKYLQLLLKIQVYFFFWLFSFRYIILRKKEESKILEEKRSILRQGNAEDRQLLYKMKKGYQAAGGLAPFGMMIMYTLSRCCPADAYPIVQQHFGYVPPARSLISRVGHHVLLIIYRAFLNKARKERLNEDQFAQFVTNLEAIQE